MAFGAEHSSSTSLHAFISRPLHRTEVAIITLVVIGLYTRSLPQCDRHRESIYVHGPVF